MIIFGSRTRGAVVAMLTLLCHQCRNPAAHQVVKRSTWFTLFFIPVIPMGPARWSTQCTFCGLVSKVTKEQAESYHAAAAAPTAPVPSPSLPPVAYGQPVPPTSFARPELDRP